MAPQMDSYISYLRGTMSKITKSSTAEYFAKNLQQVGFSSPLKAVLTTLKEAVDNSLDACEQHEILPDLEIEVTKIGNYIFRACFIDPLSVPRTR